MSDRDFDELLEAESTLHHRGSAADLCRRRGWTVGTCLVGDEGYGPTVIVITAVGEDGLLARCLSHDGETVSSRESNWELWCRDWSEVPASVVAAGLRGE